jgi:hypothetical protein
MDTLYRGAAAIRRAEAELRGLLSEAAGAARYDEVLVLGEWAKQLHGLVAGTAAGPGADGNDLAMLGTLGDENAATPAAHAIVPMTARSGAAPSSMAGNGAAGAAGSRRLLEKQRKKGAVGASSRRTSTASAYPQFHRDDNHLIKIGWSKKEKRQYEHKAPKTVLDLLVASLLAVSRDGYRFTTEDVLPLRDAGEDTDVPSYQAYLCLAWLRSVGLVEQHGRQGYSLPQPVQLGILVEDRWEGLTRR